MERGKRTYCFLPSPILVLSVTSSASSMGEPMQIGAASISLTTGEKQEEIKGCAFNVGPMDI